MALVACRECGKQISDQAKACPSCGAPVPDPPKGLQRNVGCGTTIVALLAMAGVFVAILVATNPEPTDQRKGRYADRAAYKACLEGYERANGDRRYTQSDLQAIHEVCEHLRAEFRKKWQQEP